MIEATIDFDALKNKEFVVKAEYDAELLGNVLKYILFFL